MTHFILFGQFPFSRYAHKRLVSIAQNIESMSDVEVLMYKDSFEDLTKKLVKAFSLLPVDILFDDKVVDLLNKRSPEGQRCFVEYTLMIKGDPELLSCDPYSLGYVSLSLPVKLRTNLISFEIDTEHGSHYGATDLPEEAIHKVKQDYETIKAFITDTLLALNNESQKFNLQLEELITPMLAKKMRTASHYSAMKNKLDFK